jgi:hypothetical protein
MKADTGGLARQGSKPADDGHVQDRSPIAEFSAAVNVNTFY